MVFKWLKVLSQITHCFLHFSRNSYEQSDCFAVFELLVFCWWHNSLWSDLGNKKCTCTSTWNGKICFIPCKLLNFFYLFVFFFTVCHHNGVFLCEKKFKVCNVQVVPYCSSPKSFRWCSSPIHTTKNHTLYCQYIYIDLYINKLNGQCSCDINPIPIALMSCCLWCQWDIILMFCLMM